MRTKYTKKEYLEDLRMLTSPLERKSQNGQKPQSPIGAGIAERNRAFQQALQRMRAGGMPGGLGQGKV